MLRLVRLNLESVQSKVKSTFNFIINTRLIKLVL